MNYQCPPDLDPNKDLTPNAVRLFQRFKQEEDGKTLSRLLDEETARHIKLCELAILYYANCGFLWAPLPNHPIQDVNIWADRHLEEMGFKIEHDTRGRRQEVEDETNSDQKVTTIVVEHRTTASWRRWSDRDQESLETEWNRREALEEEDRSRNPPIATSVIVGGEIKESKAAWSAILDKKYIVEVQRIHCRNFLCVFELASKQCLHFEQTDVAFGAMFGPDVGDVAMWQDRAMKIIDSLKTDTPPE
jgi:hypothetical protein